jgi:hypothetical protein
MLGLATDTISTANVSHVEYGRGEMHAMVARFCSNLSTTQTLAQGQVVTGAHTQLPIQVSNSDFTSQEPVPK